MQGNSISTTPTGHHQVTLPSQQKEQDRASGTSSPMLSTFVGQEVINKAANGFSQKNPSASTSAPSSSSTATALDASISGGAAGKKDSDLSSMCSRPKPAAVVDESPSSSLRGMSPQPSPKSRSSMTPALKPVHCEYPGCSRPAKYGQEKDSPASACQAHKRKGQYTINHKNELLIATRDGDAFRTSKVDSLAAATAVGSPPTGSKAKRTTIAPGPARPSGGIDGSGDGSSSAPSRRKQAAKPKTPPMKLFKGSNQRGPSHRHEATRESLGRPCLFPGCDAQPGYGLPGAARAVYCLSHKKGSMVRVIEKSQDMTICGQKRKTADTSSAAARGKTTNDGKKMAEKEVALAQTNTNTKANTSPNPDSNKKGTKEACRTPKADEGIKEGGNSGGGGEQGTRTSHGEGEKMPGDAKLQESVHRNTESSSSSATPPVARQAAEGQASTTATADDNTRGTAAATTPLSAPPTTPMAEISGVAPSVEMLLLRKAREAAKKEARASGRRPRAPSRRALEAAGRMQGEGAQWLTREKRAEQARVAAELREQRRQSKEAGLKFGEVLEEVVEPAAVVPGEGDNAGGGSVGGADPARIDPGWQKVPLAMQMSCPQPESITPGDGERPEKRARPDAAVTNA